MKFAKTTSFTPILNTADFGGVFHKELPLDAQGLLRPVETVAFPNTKFTVLNRISTHIIQVKTTDYPYGDRLFVDDRFLQTVSSSDPERNPVLPSPEKILNTMNSLIGTRYFWGGNCLGVPKMLELYPPQAPICDNNLKNWVFEGVDCSGLIYFATEGYTPRNTSSWIAYGESVPLEGKATSEIILALRPLDALVYPGHILFVHENHQIIESRVGRGVVLTPIETRLEELIQTQKLTLKNQGGLPGSFTVRRWHLSVM